MTRRSVHQPTPPHAFTGWLLDTYCTLPLDSRHLDVAAAGLTRLRAHAPQARHVLSTHKAFEPFKHTVDRLAADGPAEHRSTAAELAGWFTDELEERAAHLRLLGAELSWIASRPEVTDTGLAVIKGFNNIRFYSDPAPRWSRDLDLFVPDWEAAYALLTVLRRRGYNFDEQECPWFKAEPRRGRAEYGQVFLVRRQGDRYSRVDIHFGTYSVGFGEYLRCPLTDFYEPAAPGASYGGLDPTGSLLVMFAHALSDGYVSVKDVNDSAAIALTRGADVDFAVLAREVRRHALQPQALLLGRHLARRYRDKAVVSFAASLRQAAGDGRRSLLWRAHDRNWHRRAVVNADHAFRAASSLRRGPLQALRRAVQCLVFYDRRLSVRVGTRSPAQRLLLRLMARTDVTRWRLRPDACPTVIHTAHPALARALSQRSATDGPGRPAPVLRPAPVRGVLTGGSPAEGQIMVIGGDVFVCSWDQVVEEREAALTARVLHGEGSPSGDA
ncbi:nucleotidyltransferase family protein [Streptomyces canus]|uniref:nucleotidyltransferase family protein n=1 Tax=Streptomyces canus TaxID=58343 RepID=UPI0036EFF1F7